MSPNRPLFGECRMKPLSLDPLFGPAGLSGPAPGKNDPRK
jgi:hypothetical protein